ncbi:protein of unknown function [Limnospira indica PCC 8005]|uniref:Uncharacterized protein n=1 Tax=Limnospira indica PCC 8005 TaxID=376219 RepID=A0A9P1KI51_9CYAN|nr:protein of unknown function [Limnospira indica PCC 8005]
MELRINARINLKLTLRVGLSRHVYKHGNWESRSPYLIAVNCPL